MELLADKRTWSGKAGVYEIADVLLPTVDRLCAEAAAEALNDAGEAIRALADGPVPAINDAFDAVVILRARADRAASLNPINSSRSSSRER